MRECSPPTTRLTKTGKSMLAEKYKEREIVRNPTRWKSKVLLPAFFLKEKINMDWQSLIYSVLQGVMAFAAGSTRNSLASPDILGSTVRLRFRKSISGHHFQTIWKLASIDFNTTHLCFKQAQPKMCHSPKAGDGVDFFFTS